jgi:hypothetical protein
VAISVLPRVWLFRLAEAIKLLLLLIREAGGERAKEGAVGLFQHRGEQTQQGQACRQLDLPGPQLGDRRRQQRVGELRLLCRAVEPYLSPSRLMLLGTVGMRAHMPSDPGAMTMALDRVGIVVSVQDVREQQ